MNQPEIFLDIDGCVFVEKKVTGYLEYVRDDKSYWYHPDTKKNLQAVDALYNIYIASHNWRGHEKKLSKFFGVKSRWRSMKYEASAPHSNEMRPEKLEEIKKTYNGPAAIVDDRMGPAVQEWASDKIVLLVQPDPDVGLIQPHYNLLLSFGEMHRIDEESSEKRLLNDFLKSRSDRLVFSNGEWF